MSAEVVSAIAAVASAVGTVLATWAAFRSAGSAQLAQQAAAEAERRFAFRQLCLTAGEVIVEFRRVESRAVDAKQAYTTLFAFSGGSADPAKASTFPRLKRRLRLQPSSETTHSYLRRRPRA